MEPLDNSAQANASLTFSPDSGYAPPCSIQYKGGLNGYSTTQNGSSITLSNPVTAPMVAPSSSSGSYGFCNKQTGAVSVQMTFTLLIPTTSTAVPCITYGGYNASTQTIFLYAGYSGGAMVPAAATYNSFTLQGSLVGTIPTAGLGTGLNIDIEYDPTTVPLPPDTSIGTAGAKRGTVIVVPITS